MKKATLSFHGLFLADGPIKVPLHDEHFAVTCSTSQGYPEPHLTASIVDSEGTFIRNLVETSNEPTPPEQDLDSTWKVTKTFALIMTQYDVGKKVQCKSGYQGIDGFEVKEGRELAIWCACNKEGSRNMNCNPRTGQCECYPNYSGLNCNKCADGFETPPQCTGIDSKSV